MKNTLRHDPASLLRTGYTTGACSAAAAMGAALMLARQESVAEITFDLPAGISATFQLHGQKFTEEEATCYVIKDAGDDPDVTNGAEVHAQVSLTPTLSLREREQNLIITGGVGIGKVTKPGLAVPPGEWAINPVPRRMIEEAVRDAFSLQPSAFNLHVVISIPDGEERAKKTLNARLGIIGGLSILGTTGIVRPISAKAWTDTIDAALDVARACECETVILSTGRTSEMAAQRYLDIYFPEEAFIMMGDHVAYALDACAKRGFDSPIIACQFAKLLKIACGHENTHAAASELDLATLQRWADDNHLANETIAIIAQSNTAREIVLSSSFDPKLLNMVCHYAQKVVSRHANGISPRILVADYSRGIVFQSTLEDNMNS